MARLLGAPSRHRPHGREAGLIEEFGATAVRGGDNFEALQADLWPGGMPTVVIDLVEPKRLWPGPPAASTAAVDQ